MKNSNIQWIGDIPDNWEIYTIKHLFKIGRGRVISELELVDDGKYPVYSSQTQNNGCMGYINTYDFDLQQLTWTTDGVYAGTVFIRSGKHNCTNVCGTLQLKLQNHNLLFIKYALEFIAVYHRRKDINGGKIMNNEMAQIKIPLPPLATQTSIATYLDTKCSEIDGLIADINKQIETLNELKKSTITEAVTKGLNKNAKLKDSGIQWIGMIPEGWSVSRVKYLTSKIGSGKTPKGDASLYSEGEILFLRSQNIYNTGLVLDEKNTVITDDIDREMSNSRVYKDDVLLNITGGSIGRCCIYNRNQRANVNQHVCIIRVNKELILPSIMHYFWISNIGQTAIQLYQTGGNREGMSAEAIKKTIIPIMDKAEQHAIASYLDTKCTEFDSIIRDKQKQISTLEAYKKSLIYEYVTGKNAPPVIDN